MSVAGRTFEIAKAVGFEAAHFLDTGKPGHPYGRMHGHSFRIEAKVAGTITEGEAWVEDLARLSEALQAVADALDHRLLNEVDGLVRPTLERLCVWIAERLKPDLPGLSEVSVERPSLHERCTLRLG